MAENVADLLQSDSRTSMAPDTLYASGILLVQWLMIGEEQKVCKEKSMRISSASHTLLTENNSFKWNHLILWQGTNLKVHVLSFLLLLKVQKSFKNMTC